MPSNPSIPTNSIKAKPLELGEKRKAQQSLGEESYTFERSKRSSKELYNCF